MKQKLIIRIISKWFFLYYLVNEMFVSIKYFYVKEKYTLNKNIKK